MAKTCDLLKLMLVICCVEFSLALPLSSEDVFDNSAVSEKLGNKIFKDPKQLMFCMQNCARNLKN